MLVMISIIFSAFLISSGLSLFKNLGRSFVDISISGSVTSNLESSHTGIKSIISGGISLAGILTRIFTKTDNSNS